MYLGTAYLARLVHTSDNSVREISFHEEYIHTIKQDQVIFFVMHVNYAKYIYILNIPTFSTR